MKNKILKAITWTNGIICLISALSLDTASWIPTIALVLSGCWLILFGLANGWFEGAVNNVQNR